jgi:hypothetical protein
MNQHHGASLRDRALVPSLPEAGPLCVSASGNDPSRRRRDDWMPIETAPTNGTRFWARASVGNITEGWAVHKRRVTWRGRAGWCFDPEDEAAVWRPAHWWPWEFPRAPRLRSAS